MLLVVCIWREWNEQSFEDKEMMLADIKDCHFKIPFYCICA